MCFQGAGLLVLWRGLRTKVSELVPHLYWQWKWVGGVTGPAWLHGGVHQSLIVLLRFTIILCLFIMHAASLTDLDIQQVAWNSPVGLLCSREI